MAITCLFLTGCGSSASTDVVTESELDEEQIAKEIAESEAMEAEKLEIYGETEEVEESEATTVPNIKTITITATGDCSLGKTPSQGYSGSFAAMYDSRGADYFFKGVRDVFENDDFTLINLECVLTDSNAKVDKEYNIKGLPEYTDIMSGSSVEAVTLGNNHSSDYGPGSLSDTKKNVTAAGILYAYNDEVGMFTTDEGLKVGYVSASLLNLSDVRINYIKDGIAELRNQGADIVIACPHWGIEREYYPRSIEKSMAHDFIDCGADLVIGNHPHVLQGVEVYKGKVICYSLGNFCFGANRNPSDKDTMMFQQTFTFVEGNLQADINAQIIPCTVSSRRDYNDFQPTIAEAEKMQAIIDDVNTYSKTLGGVTFDSKGKLVVVNEESEEDIVVEE